MIKGLKRTGRAKYQPQTVAQLDTIKSCEERGLVPKRLTVIGALKGGETDEEIASIGLKEFSGDIVHQHVKAIGPLEYTHAEREGKPVIMVAAYCLPVSDLTKEEWQHRTTGGGLIGSEWVPTDIEDFWVDEHSENAPRSSEMGQVIREKSDWYEVEYAKRPICLVVKVGGDIQSQDAFDRVSERIESMMNEKIPNCPPIIFVPEGIDIYDPQRPQGEESKGIGDDYAKHMIEGDGGGAGSAIDHLPSD